MDFQKLILWLALSFTLLMLWEAWKEDYGLKPVQPTAISSTEAEISKDTPSAPTVTTATQGVMSNSDTPSAQPSAPGMKVGQRISINTDLVHAEIDTTGGDLRLVDLLNYPKEANHPEVQVRLMNDSGADVFIAQSGLLPSSNMPGSAAPNHHAVFTSNKSEYSLADGQDTLDVRMYWNDGKGVQVIKIYTFHRGSYEVGVRYELKNNSGQDWKGHMYRQLQRSEIGRESMFLYTYTGGVVYSEEEKYEKIDFSDMADKPFSRDITGGWGAMIQHYFLGAWVPAAQEGNHYYSKSPGNNRYIIGMIGQENTIAAGETGTLQAKLYVGPKLQDSLEEVAPGLELTVDYGILTLIAEPLFWLLDKIHGVVKNWGWSIIILTIFIKLAFYKLSETSYRSMANMRKLQPRLAAIKERHGSDREALNRAMMTMYKEEKINPLGGCLPILAQIPVFISLYWVLLESVELRQADFILWLNDLSSADPYFVLPLLMGATMLIQFKLNPTPLDPIQAKVMMMLPIIFTVFFAFFPAGLVLYWVANNTLSIAQQWYITRKIERGEK